LRLELEHVTLGVCATPGPFAIQMQSED